MSWAREEWKDGLSHKVLAKFNEIEQQNEKLRKETKQKQLQIESLDAAFTKQKKKIDDEKSEIASLKRENNSLAESCVRLEQKIEKLACDVRHKDSHVTSLESQLQRFQRQADSLSNKVVKQEHTQQDTENLRSKIREMEILLENERKNCNTLQKQVTELMHSKPVKRSYIPSMPWATDDAVSTPLKPKQPIADLLTGSPISSTGSGDAVIPFSQSMSCGDLSQSLEDSNKKVKELEMKLKLRDGNSLTKNTNDEKLQIKLEEAEYQVSHYGKKIHKLSEELKSEKHNAESIKVALQSKLLESEKLLSSEISQANVVIKTMKKQIEENELRYKKEISSVRNELNLSYAEIEKKNFAQNKMEAEMKMLQQKLLQMEQMHQSVENKFSISHKMLNESQVVVKETTAELEQFKDKNMALEKMVEVEKKNFINLQSKVTEAERLIILKVDEMNALKKTSQEAIMLLENQLEDVRLQLSNVESKKSNAENLLKQKKNVCFELERQLETLKNNISEDQTKLEREGKQCLELAKENNMLIEQNESTILQLKKAKQDMEKLKEFHKREIEEAEREIQQHGKRSNEKQEATKIKFQQEFDEISFKHQQETNDLKMKVESQDKVIHNLEQRMEIEEKKLLKSDEELHNLALSLKEAKKKNKNLGVELKSIKVKEEELQSLIDKLEVKVKQFESEAATTLKEKTVLEEKYKSVVLKAREDSIERKCLEGRVQDLEDQVSRMQEDENRDLKILFAESQEENRKLHEMLDNCEISKQQKSAEVDNLGSELTQLRESMDAAVKERREEEEKWRSDSSKMQSTIHILKQKFDENNAQVDDLISQKESLASELEERTWEYREMEVVSQQLKDSGASLDEKFENLQKSFLDVDGKLKLSESQCLETERSLSKALAELGLKEGELKKYEQQVCELQKELDDVSCKLSSSHDHVTKLNKVIVELEEKVDMMMSEKYGIEIKLESSQTNIQNLEEKLRAITEKNKEVEKILLEKKNLESTLSKTLLDFEKSEYSLSQSVKEVQDLESDIVVVKQQLELNTENYNKEKGALVGKLLTSEDNAHNLSEVIESLKLEQETLVSEKIKVQNLSEERLKFLEQKEEEFKKKDREFIKCVGFCGKMKQELVEFKETVVGLEGKNQLLLQTISQKENVILNFEVETESQKEKFASKLQQLSKEHEVVKEKLKENLGKLKNVEEIILCLKRDKELLQEKFDNSCLKLEKLEGQFEILQMDSEDKDEIIKDYEKNVIPNLRVQLHETESRSSDLINEIKGLHEEKLSSDNELNLMENNCLNSEKQISILKLQLENLFFDQKTLKNEIEKFEKSKLQLHNMTEELGASLKKSESENINLAEQNANLNNRVHGLQEVRNQLHEKVNLLTQEFKGKLENYENVKKEIKDLQVKVKSLQAVVDEDKETVDNLRETINKQSLVHSGDVEDLNEEIVQLEIELETLKEERTLLEIENNEMSSKMDNQDLLCQKFEEENLLLRNETELLKEKLAINVETVAKCNEHANWLKLELEKEKADHCKTKSNSTAHLQTLQNQLDSKSHELKAVCIQLNENKSQISEMSSTVKKQENVISGLKEICGKLKNQNELAESRIQTLTRNLTEVGTSIGEMRNKLESSEERITQMRVDHENHEQFAKENLLATEKELTDLKSSHADLVLKLDEQNVEIDELRGKLDEQTSHSGHLREQCLKLKNEKVLLEESLLEVQGRVGIELKRVEELDQELIQTTRKLDEVLESSNITISSLNQQLHDLGNRLVVMTMENSRLGDLLCSKNQEFDQQQSLSDELKLNVENLRQQCNAVVAERDFLQVGLKDGQREAEKLKQERTEKQEEFDGMKQNYEEKFNQMKMEFGQNVECLKNKVECLKKENQHLGKVIGSKSTEFEKLNDDFNKISTICMKSEEKNLHLGSKNKELMNEIREFFETIDNLNQGLESAQDKNNGLEQNVKDLKKCLSEKESNFAQMEKVHKNVVEEFEKKVESFQQKISQLLSNLDVRDRDVNSSNEKVKQLKNDVAMTTQMVSDLQDDWNRKDDELSEAGKKLELLEKKLEKLVEENKVLEMTKGELSENVKFLENSLADETENSRKKLEGKEVEVEEMTEEMNRLHGNIHEINEKFHTIQLLLDDETSNKEAILKQNQSYIDSLKLKADKLQTSLVEKVGKISILQSELGDNLKAHQLDKMLLEQMKEQKGDELSYWNLQQQEHSVVIDTLTNEKCELLQKLETVGQEYAESSIEVSSLKYKVILLNEKLDDSTSEKTRLENKSREHEAVVCGLEGELGRLKVEVVMGTDKIDNLEFKVSNIEMEKKDVDDSLEEARNKITSLESTHHEMMERSNRMLEDYNKVEKERFRLQLKVEDLTLSQNDLQSNLSSLKLTHEGMIAELQKQVTGMEEKSSVVTSQCSQKLQEKQKVIIELENTKLRLLEDVQSLQTQLNESKGNNFNLKEKVCHMEEELEKLNFEAKMIEVRKYETKSTSDDLTVANMKVELDSKISIIGDLEQQLMDVKSSGDSNEAKLILATSHLEDKNKKLSNKLEENLTMLDGLEECLAAKSTNIEQLQATIDKLERDLSKAGNVTQEIVQKNQELNMEKEELKKIVEDQLQDMEESRRKLEDGVKMLDEMKLKHQCEIEVLSEEKVHCQNELHDVDHKLEEAKNEVFILKASNDGMETQCKDAEKQIAKLHVRIREYQESQRGYVDAASLAEKQTAQVRHELEMKLKEKQEELKKVSLLSESTHTKFQHQLVEIKKLCSVNEQLRLENESLQTLVTDHNEFNSSTEVKISEYLQELENLRSLNKGLDEENMKLKQQKCDLLKTKNVLEAELEGVSEQQELKNETLFSQVVSFQDKLETLQQNFDEKISECNNADYKIRELEEKLDFSLKQTDYLSEETQAISLKYEDLKILHDNTEEERIKYFKEFQTIENKNKELENEVEKREENIKLLEEGISHRDEQTSQLRKELSIVETVVSEKDESILNMAKKLEHLNEVVEHEAEKHKIKLSNCEADNEILLQEKQDLQQEIENFQIKLRLLDNDVEFRDQKILQFDEQVMDLEERLVDAENANDCWKEKYRSLKIEATSMENMLIEARTQVNKHTEYCQHLESGYEKNNIEVENLREVIESLQQRLHEECGKVGELEQNVAEEKMKFLNEKKDFEEKLLICVKEREEKFLNKKREMEKQTEKILNDFKNLNQEINRLEMSEKQLKVENEGFRHRETENNILANSKLNSVLQDIQQLKSDAEKLEIEKQRLQNQLNESRVKIDVNSSSHKMEKLLKQNEQMTAKVCLMTNNARRNEKEMNCLKAKLQEMENKNELGIQLKSRTSLSSDAKTSDSTKLLEEKKQIRRKSRRLSLKKGAKALPPDAPRKTPPKKSKLTDEDSSSPQLSIEGLPHLVKQGFTNIPVGFSSPFVMRRQQLNQTSRLVAAAMTKNIKDSSTRDEKPLRSMQLRSHKTVSPPTSQPLKLLTNSPKLSHASSGESRGVTEDNPDCKMQ